MFLMKAQIEENTKPLHQDAAELYAIAIMCELEGKKSLKELCDDPGIKILEKRIDILELPIKFTEPAKVGVMCLSEFVPGKIMTILIDCLTKHEGSTVNMSMLSNMYPYGFYSDDVFDDYVVNYIKSRSVKWSEIY